MLDLFVLTGRRDVGVPRNQELILENIALQQQLRAMKRTTKRPHLRRARPCASPLLRPAKNH
jgi:hypothetical protein